jgi:hypothetical protein
MELKSSKIYLDYEKCIRIMIYYHPSDEERSMWEVPAEDHFQILQGKVTNILAEITALSPLHKKHFFRVSKGQKQRLLFAALFSFPLLLACLSPCPYVAIYMPNFGIKVKD